MRNLNLLLLTIVALAFTATTQSTDVTIHVEIEPTPATQLPLCSAPFLSALLEQLAGWVQKQVSHSIPDLVVGDFTLTYHELTASSRRRELTTTTSAEVDAQAGTTTTTTNTRPAYDAFGRRLAVSGASCGACTVPGSGCTIACAAATCTVCGVTSPEILNDTGLYKYMSETIQKFARNYVFDPNVTDNGCVGEIPKLNLTASLTPNQVFDATPYPTVTATVAIWQATIAK